MRFSRRLALASLLASPGIFRGLLQASAPRFLIVSANSGTAHTVVIEEMQRALAARPIVASTFRLPSEGAAFEQALQSGSSQLAIAVGLDALRAIVTGKTRIPLLTTMAFRADLNGSGILESAGVQLSGAVWLDLTLAQIVTGVRLVFPKISRIAVIRNPSHSEASSILVQTRQPIAGVNLRVTDCYSSADLLPTLRKLRGEADLVVCLPDSTLYNKSTVEPLILASLEHRLPLAGFSSSFVKAGAAVGVFPDFAGVGRQTAALAEKCLAAPAGTREEFPKKTLVAANERVLHLLGCDFREPRGEEVLIVK